MAVECDIISYCNHIWWLQRNADSPSRSSYGSPVMSFTGTIAEKSEAYPCMDGCSEFSYHLRHMSPKASMIIPIARAIATITAIDTSAKEKNK